MVVIDGASSDGTWGWLESQRRASLHALISSPMAVYAAAMNLGVTTSARRLAPVPPEPTIASRAAPQWPTCGAVAAADTTQACSRARTIYTDGRMRGPGPRRLVRARNFVQHQAAIYRRPLLIRHGGFDESLRVVADYDLNLRLWRRGVVFEPAGLRLTVCGVGGLSDSGRWLGYAEEIRVRHRHFPAWQCWPWDAASLSRFVRKRLLVALRRAARRRPPRDRSPLPDR